MTSNGEHMLMAKKDEDGRIVDSTSPEHFRALLQAAGLSQTEAAKQMHVSRRSVVEWCKDGGAQRAPFLARVFLERFNGGALRVRIKNLLRYPPANMQARELEEWLDALDGKANPALIAAVVGLEHAVTVDEFARKVKG